LGRVAKDAAKAVFDAAAVAMVDELLDLHGKCKQVQDSSGGSLDQAMDAVQASEKALFEKTQTAVGNCEPLLSLVSSDRVACQQLVAGLQEQLTSLSTVFCEGCQCLITLGDADDLRSHAKTVDALSTLEWSGLFALSVVWLGQRLQDKVLRQAWAQSRALIAGTEVADSGAVEQLEPGPVVKHAATSAAEELLAHYVRVSGQRLAHFLRNAIQRKGWAQATKAPQEPSLVVEMVLKEFVIFDAQLARFFGGPRNPRGSGNRRSLNVNKSAMEMDLERQWAKKAQVFTSVPFTRNGAVAAVLSIAFKALFEYVRGETFSTFGLQQLQLDAEFLLEASRDFVEPEDGGNLGSLVAEAVSSASQRCTQQPPVLLEPAVLEALVSQNKKNIRAE